VSQTKRRKALAPVRERERVAQELAALLAAETLGAKWTLKPLYLARIKDGAHFDVHAAREHAQALIGRAHREAGRDHWAVFSDWRMEHPTTPASESPLRSSGRARSWERLGRAILRALEGQPSECRACSRWGPVVRAPNWMPAECPDCRGTRHNLRGTLPPVEWSPAVRRRAMDCFYGRDAGWTRHGVGWLFDAYKAGRESDWTLRRPHATDEPGDPVRDVRTRVVPRGEHRDRRSNFSPWLFENWAEKSTLDERITARAESGFYARERLPRWRRGELRHAAARRMAAVDHAHARPVGSAITPSA
jgi:hypothetical protein